MTRLAAHLNRRRSCRGDDGFTTLEVVLLAPLFVLMLLLIVILGRVQQAGAEVTGAARDGARAASLSNTPAQASSNAQQAVTAALASQALACTGGPTTTVDTSNFRPGGVVGVTVSCIVPLSDVGFTAMPGSRTMTRQGASPIETYRSGT